MAQIPAVGAESAQCPGVSICNPHPTLAPVSWQVSNASARSSFLILASPPPTTRGAAPANWARLWSGWLVAPRGLSLTLGNACLPAATCSFRIMALSLHRHLHPKLHSWAFTTNSSFAKASLPLPSLSLPFPGQPSPQLGTRVAAYPKHIPWPGAPSPSSSPGKVLLPSHSSPTHTSVTSSITAFPDPFPHRTNCSFLPSPGCGGERSTGHSCLLLLLCKRADTADLGSTLPRLLGACPVLFRVPSPHLGSEPQR